MHQQVQVGAVGWVCRYGQYPTETDTETETAPRPEATLQHLPRHPERVLVQVNSQLVEVPPLYCHRTAHTCTAP